MSVCLWTKWLWVWVQLQSLIIDVVDVVEKKKQNICGVKKLDEEENFIFTAFPTFKKMVKKIEEDEMNQGSQCVKVKK